MTYQGALRIVRTLIAEAVAQKNDVYYEYKVPDLAKEAARVFTGGNKTQMKNLEKVALNAGAMADVLNYIKSQAGKDTRVGTLWRTNDFASQLHDTLWDTVDTDSKNITKNIWTAIEENRPQAIDALNDWGYNQQDIGREIRLRLTRLFVQHLEAQYLYNHINA